MSFKPGDFVLVNCPAYALRPSLFPAVIYKADTTHGYDWRILQIYVRDGEYWVEPIPFRDSDALPFYERELVPWENPYTFKLYDGDARLSASGLPAREPWRPS